MSDRVHRKDKLNDIIDDLNRRKRSIEALRLLIEDDDADTALTMSLRLRADIDRIIGQLRELTGEEAPAEPRAHAAAEPERESPAPSPASAARQGYLGDADEPGGFEKWVEKIVNGVLEAVAHPRRTMRRFHVTRNTLITVACIAMACYTGWQAYAKTYLSQHGLTGEYYQDDELKNLFTKRQDTTINFRWLRRSPISGFRSEHFSVRWTGFVKTDQSGKHEFYTISDDGVRLWIDDQKLIDDWSIHGSTIDKGEINLNPGFHRVVIEYYQGAGDSVMKLQWKRPSDSDRKTIGTRYLFPKPPDE
jgi:hypothetical protein